MFIACQDLPCFQCHSPDRRSKTGNLFVSRARDNPHVQNPSISKARLHVTDLERSTDGSFESLVVPLPSELRPVDAFQRLCDRPHCLFLDSALPHSHLGRYSYITADPFRFLSIPADGREALGSLEAALAACPIRPRSDLPEFQGGAAGLLSYDLARSLEQLPRSRYEEFPVPALAMGLYDVVLAFDHCQSQGWIISQGWPESTAEGRRRRAADRIQQFQSWLARDPLQVVRRPSVSFRPELVSRSPHYPVGPRAGLWSNFSEAGYLQAVQATIDYILAGDLFQANLAQRLLYPAAEDAVSLYLRLRRCNPATFAAYFDLGEIQIVSASPERFLRVQQGQVETRPIKGTRPRVHRPEVDLFSRDELRESTKDRAENVMIVDLLRNDLSRVCRPDSVRVEQLCAVETYEFVQHLVSVVRGQLAEDRTTIDLLRAAFPGGSITGAPKVRAMEVISELEPHARGAYCGSLGFLSPDGTLDVNILIRTITVAQGWWQLSVGGGIVAQSDPRQEYAETWHKAEGLLRAVLPEKP